MKTVDFSETIAGSDLKVGRCRQLIEFMKVCIEGQGHFFTIYYPGFVCFVLYQAKISGEPFQDHWSSGFITSWPGCFPGVRVVPYMLLPRCMSCRARLSRQQKYKIVQCETGDKGGQDHRGE